MKVALLRSEDVVPALSGPEAVFTEFGTSNEVKSFCQTTVHHTSGVKCLSLKTVVRG